MYSLVLKDILIQKKPVLLSFGYSIFLFVAFGMGKDFTASNIYIMGTIALTILFIQSSCYSDDKNNSYIILHSLPTNRGEIVMAKYVASFIFLIFNLIVLSIVGLGFSYINSRIGSIEISQIILSLIIASLAIALYLPIFFKLGYIKSKIFNTGLFLSFFFLPVALISYVVDHQDRAWAQFIIDFFQGSSQAMVLVMGIVLSLIFLFISFSLSVKFYSKREF